jgi:hypothetical protein
MSIDVASSVTPSEPRTPSRFERKTNMLDPYPARFSAIHEPRPPSHVGI